MPEATLVVNGEKRQWILKRMLDTTGEGDVWSGYNFTEYLKRAGLNPETIRINSMTRQRFLNECDQIFKKPKYAIKFLNNPTPASLKMMGQEVDALKKLDDPHIITIYDYMIEMPPPKPQEEEPEQEGAEEKQATYPPFYVMELIEGETLAELAEKKKEFQGKVHESLALMVEMATALSMAHKAGVVHRDLKPENILVRTDGTPVIIDFGICHVINGMMYNLTGKTSEVRCFMPPELTAIRVRDEDVCGANDIYSFGKLLYYLISGGKQLPHDYYSRPEYDLRLKYPSKQMDSAYKIFERTITENVEQRIQSIEELLETIKDELVEGTTCIFCHGGVYQELSGEILAKLWTYSQSAEIRQYRPRLYVCDKCGNLQYFCESRIIDRYKA